MDEKSIIIATRNKARAQGIILAIGRIDGIKILTLDDVQLQDTPSEIGSNEMENALMKAHFYFERLHIPVITVDDGLHLENPSLDPAEKIKRHEDGEWDNKRVFDYWKNALQEHGEQKGYIEKACAIVNSKREIIWMNQINVSLAPADRTYTEGNPLNHFMIPECYTNCIHDLVGEQKKQFTLECYSPIIELIKIYAE